MKVHLGGVASKYAHIAPVCTAEIRKIYSNCMFFYFLKALLLLNQDDC